MSRPSMSRNDPASGAAQPDSTASASMKLRYRSPMSWVEPAAPSACSAEARAAASTISRTACSASSRSSSNAPNEARSAGMPVVAIHAPLTWR